MEKRSDERTPVSIITKFFCGDRFYSGIIRNMSKAGILIESIYCFPQNTPILITVSRDEKITACHGKVRWIQKVDGNYRAMGVQAYQSDVRYVNLINDIRDNEQTLSL